MVWEDVEVDIEGFSPSEQNQSSIAFFTDIFRDISPAGSFVKLTIRKSHLAYEGTVNVMAMGEKFVVDATRFSIQRTLQALLEALESRMKHWHALQKLRSDYV